ncbi:exported hypothetical protein [uncultured Eubacteriales bacterium]|uniref:SLH domain-containing protein n=1 Tax=uncultured Eubacteriales bacterium TaxID=172733 RepID=A0A212IZR9_9FIRM|nr:exported hypothetical protein [uncultured Eubacteriales bacterium]
MKKRLLAFTLVGALTLSTFAPALAAEAPRFSDVDESAWYAQVVSDVARQGVMVGDGKGSFAPSGLVTRAALVQTLYNLAGRPEARGDGFADAAGTWYAPAAAWAEETGLVDGDTSFDGARVITRAEMAVLLAGYAKLVHLPAFADHGKAERAPDYASVPDDTTDAVAWCVNAGLMNGDGAGYLNPASSATRAELAKMLQAVLGLDVVPMEDYLAANSAGFFLTGKTSYAIQGKMVSGETQVHNFLEDVDYTVADDGQSVVLKGVVGEEWVTKLSKVLTTYTKEDGSALTAEDFTEHKDTYISLKTKASPDTNFALYIPAGVAVEVETAWGDVLYANRSGVPHGAGDYLVCANKDGKPDLSDVWVVNGAVFGSNYDTSRGPQMGTVTEIEKYGHAVLSISIEDFTKAGFTLGDTVNVTFDNGYTLTGIPYFDGYYVEKGAPMLRAYPGHTSIAVCINYGKLNVVADVAKGSVAAVTLAAKGGELAAQELNSLVYTNVRGDYASDEIFANFRTVTVGDIAEGILYRSASPINNENNRAAYSDKLIAAAEVATVLNLADTDADLQRYLAAEDFDSPYYKSLYEAGSVIALGMSVDYSSVDFANKLVSGLALLSEKKGPYLVHCTEGKDRAGFTSALLECLMGAGKDAILSDYMVSFANYYGVTKESDPTKYDIIVNNNIMDMLRVIAGVEKGTDLSGVDLQKGAERFLTGHGMTEQQVANLKANLSTAPGK